MEQSFAYIVACLDDDGFMVLATRRIFDDPGEACTYARGCSPARKPYVISGDWRNLRDKETAEMWVMLNDSFLSIVAHPERSKLLVVRARLAQDIRNVFPDARIAELPNRDYQFRTTLKRSVVERAMAIEVRRIDYTNFKDSVPEQKRHDLYLRVWSVMAQLARRTVSRTSSDLRWDTASWGLPLEQRDAEETPAPAAPDRRQVDDA